jgi:hypothetical protein
MERLLLLNLLNGWNEMTIEVDVEIETPEGDIIECTAVMEDYEAAEPEYHDCPGQAEHCGFSLQDEDGTPRPDLYEHLDEGQEEEITEQLLAQVQEERDDAKLEAQLSAMEARDHYYDDDCW